MLDPRSADSDAVGAVIDSFQSGLSWRATQAVLITIVTQLAVGTALLLAFMILRPRNKILFMRQFRPARVSASADARRAARYKYSADNHKPPKLSDGPFGWLPPIIKLREPEMLDKVGLDAVVYLRFLRMIRWLCLVITLGSVGVLLPINYLYNVRRVTREQGFLTKITISNVTGKSVPFFLANRRRPAELPGQHPLRSCRVHLLRLCGDVHLHLLQLPPGPSASL